MRANKCRSGKFRNEERFPVEFCPSSLFPDIFENTLRLAGYDITVTVLRLLVMPVILVLPH